MWTMSWESIAMEESAPVLPVSAFAQVHVPSVLLQYLRFPFDESLWEMWTMSLESIAMEEN